MNQINVNISQTKNSISAEVKNVVPINPAKGTFKINENGKFNVKEFEFADVNVVNDNTQKKSLTISKNGSYEILPDENYFLEKASVNVNVPIPEGYVKPSGTLNVDKNNVYDVKSYEKVNVAVPMPEGNIDITSTKEYDVTQYATAKIKDDNLKPENIAEGVKVLDITGTHKAGIFPSGTIEITENGEYNVTDKASVNVNVASSGGEDMLQARVDSLNSCKYLMYEYEGTNVSFLSRLDTSKVTNMESMFSYCKNITSCPDFNTSNVTSMRSMFYYCNNLASVPLFDTSNVTNMGSMFYYCNGLTSVPLFDTSKVSNMDSMFSFCTKITTIPLFDTSNVTSMINMFYYCNNLTTIPAFNVSNVTNLNGTFNYCSALKSILMYGMKVPFNISASTKFAREDLVTILNNLGTVTTATTLTMGSINLAKLTDTDKEIATNKGWTLA